MGERAARLKQGLQEEGHLVDVDAESSREVAEVTLIPYATECRLLLSEPTRNSLWYDPGKEFLGSYSVQLAATPLLNLDCSPRTNIDTRNHLPPP